MHTLKEVPRQARARRRHTIPPGTFPVRRLAATLPLFQQPFPSPATQLRHTTTPLTTEC